MKWIINLRKNQSYHDEILDGWSARTSSLLLLRIVLITGTSLFGIDPTESNQAFNNGTVILVLVQLLLSMEIYRKRSIDDPDDTNTSVQRRRNSTALTKMQLKRD